MKLEFSLQIFDKTLKYLILCESVQREPSCSSSTDRQTELTKLIVTFRNSRNAIDSRAGIKAEYEIRTS